jgi:hypothetical protein
LLFWRRKAVPVSINIKEFGYHEAQPQTISPPANQLLPLTSVENVENKLVKDVRRKPLTRLNDILWET